MSMKKIYYLLLCAFALVAVTFTSCKDDDDKNLDNLTGDGFYVVGEACPFKSISENGANASLMAVGRNEAAGKEKRDGMYEKYIYLEKDKNFALVLKENDSETTYGADADGLKAVELDGTNDQPTGTVYKGKLAKDGVLKVPADGFYHIVLDLNLTGDLDLAGGAQIVVVPVKWSVSGGMNSWSLTEGTLTKISNTELKVEWKDQALAAGAEFKFKNQGWKIQLDDAGKVKADLSLGEKCEAGGANISVAEGGYYDITLNFKMAAGDIAKSYTYTATWTKEVVNNVYLCGEEFGSNSWTSEGVVEAIQVNSHAGVFWIARYMTANKAFKFAKTKADADVFSDYKITGYTTAGVAENGLYTFVINTGEKTITATKTKVFGKGDAFGGWGDNENPVEPVPFTINADGTATVTVQDKGNLRMYVEVEGADWWQSEFNIYDGKIVYRGAGNDQDAVAVEKDQVVTLNFNAGTGSIVTPD